MEITNEAKAKVLAQYLGQPFAYWFNGERRSDGPVDFLVLKEVSRGQNKYETKPILRPLSAITDEDAIECYKIIDPRGKVEGCEYWTHRHKPKSLDNPNRAAISIDVRRVDVVDECLNIGFESGSIVYYTDRGKPELERIEKQIQVFQYLQSKGYDLPMWLLGGKTLKEAGLAVYEND